MSLSIQNSPIDLTIGRISKVIGTEIPPSKGDGLADVNHLGYSTTGSDINTRPHVQIREAARRHANLIACEDASTAAWMVESVTFTATIVSLAGVSDL